MKNFDQITITCRPTFNNFTEFEKVLEQYHCYTWHVTCCRFSTITSSSFPASCL